MEFAYLLLALFVIGIPTGLWLLDPKTVPAKSYYKYRKYQIAVPASTPDMVARIMRRFDDWTEPVLPFKRGFTEEEHKTMLRFYKDFGWSDIDAEGKIVLNGGEEASGLRYITEEDLLDEELRLPDVGLEVEEDLLPQLNGFELDFVLVEEFDTLDCTFCLKDGLASSFFCVVGLLVP